MTVAAVMITPDRAYLRMQTTIQWNGNQESETMHDYAWASLPTPTDMTF
jgi:hypothetical protein